MIQNLTTKVTAHVLYKIASNKFIEGKWNNHHQWNKESKETVPVSGTKAQDISDLPGIRWNVNVQNIDFLLMTV